jgi:hypothetical protein
MGYPPPYPSAYSGQGSEEQAPMAAFTPPRQPAIKLSFVHNVVTYSWRFAGDLVSLLVGILSLVPLAFSYAPKAPAWLTSDAVKWSTLTAGFFYVSYRLWLRAEHSRTSDAFRVLIIDANEIYATAVTIVELYDWPPPYTLPSGETTTTVWPLRDKTVDNMSLLLELHRLEARISRHTELVLRVAKEHGIEVTLLLDSKSLNAKTWISDIRDYIESLKDLAKPPRSWFETLSTRRCQR